MNSRCPSRHLKDDTIEELHESDRTLPPNRFSRDAPERPPHHAAERDPQAGRGQLPRRARCALRSPRWAWSSEPLRSSWWSPSALTGKQYILEQIQKVETNSVELEYAGGGATGNRASALQRLPHPRRRESRGCAVARHPVLLARAWNARPHQLRRRRSQGYAGARRQPAISKHPQPAGARRPLFRRQRRRRPHQVRRGHGTIRPRTVRQQ